MKTKIIFRLTGICWLMCLGLVIPSLCWAEPLIINHEDVDKIDDIPDEWIAVVKTMLLNVPGESHSKAYRQGLVTLSQTPGYEQFAVVSTDNAIMFPPETQHLRITPAYRNQNNTGYLSSCGEEEFWTSQAAIDLMKQHLTYMRYTANNPVHAFGFGWCWDMTGTPGGGIDPVYQVRWAGKSYTLSGGDQGRWGLDDGDTVLTGNSINMQMYLDAVDAYNAHDPQTVTFFTTGPVDGSSNTGESGYQRHLKHEFMKDYVAQSENGVLFDYADILTHGPDGTENTVTWQGHVFPFIHPYNTQGEYVAHIGMNGAVRLAKALWVMMARIAGWDGLPYGGGNTPPNANNDTFTVAEDSQIYCDVLANDTDADEDPLQIEDIPNPPDHGTASIAGADILYIPDTNYNGADSFTYTISDGNGGTDSANVAITVTPVNDPPDAVNDIATVLEDSANNQIMVLTNDSDIENNTLHVTGASDPLHGSTTYTDSLVIYTPDADFSGDDSFTYTISDGNGGTDTANVTVSITPVAENYAGTLIAWFSDSEGHTSQDCSIPRGHSLFLNARYTNTADAGLFDCLAYLYKKNPATGEYEPLNGDIPFKAIYDVSFASGESKAHMGLPISTYVSLGDYKIEVFMQAPDDGSFNCAGNPQVLLVSIVAP